MRILIAGMSSALGGMERRMETESLFLKGMGHEVIVATPNFPGSTEWAQHLGTLGLKHVVWGPYKVFERMHLMLPFVWYANSTAHTVRDLKIDFALVCVPWNFVGMTMANILTDLGISFALAIHSKLSNQKPTSKAKIMLCKALKKCVGVYGVSDPVTRSFQLLYANLLPEKCLISTVPNGVDTEKFCPDRFDRVAIRKSLGFSHGEKVILFCGRLDSTKRPLLATEAFSTLAKKDSTFRFLVVGSGAEELAMKTMLDRFDLRSRSVFAGYVSDTSPYFAASDCYLSTSEREGSPLTAAEAASSGLTLVLTDDDVNRSIYSECLSATFCSSSKAFEWASKIEIAFGVKEHAQHSNSEISRNFALEKLSLVVMEKYLNIFYRAIFELPI